MRVREWPLILVLGLIAGASIQYPFDGRSFASASAGLAAQQMLQTPGTPTSTSAPATINDTSDAGKIKRTID